MYTSLSDQAMEQGREIWSWVESPVAGGAAITAFMVVVMSNMGFWATLAADMPSLSRFFKAPKNERNWFKRNKSQIVGSIIVMPIVNTFMIIIGAVSYIAVSNFDPVAALQEAASGFVLRNPLLMIVFAQWSTNTSANVSSSCYDFLQCRWSKSAVLGRGHNSWYHWDRRTAMEFI